jgi:hypothetical protein
MMTPKKRGIERLRREARNDAAFAVFKIVFFGTSALLSAGGILFLIYLILDGLRITGGALFIILIPAGVLAIGVCAWFTRWLAPGFQKESTRRLHEIERMVEAQPFYEAYRNGQTISERLPQKNNELQKLREKYHQLKEAVEAQLKTHKEEKEWLQKTGNIEDAQGMAALILDLEDAEKQLQKELSFIERASQPIQTPQVTADPPPITRLKPSRETGLEDY